MVGGGDGHRDAFVMFDSFHNQNKQGFSIAKLQQENIYVSRRVSQMDNSSKEQGPRVNI